MRCSLDRMRDTSAKLTGSFASVPLKMTSCMLEERIDLVDCSPSAHLIPSARFDLPQPFGPTTAVTPGSKLSSVFSAKDLKPTSSRRLKYIYESFYAYNI